eukprot:CAMPEP_0113523872 /NCGR_PEP_ID=MMETSP0014_2-20120614/45924_1 /TAXON_ID=2857 /ORGANISM="Nitzschia sp." /LENGTH=533 /DNA_ID=CAMNT_0000421965 /DNA_START=125 /DNA_END=1726 /DNA_ORIENTATION=- /assembly_acc=CAM_ASM_000159
MSDSEDDDLFADSSDSDGNDTDDLIAESKKAAAATKASPKKPIAKKKIIKKKGSSSSGDKRKRIPDADNDDDDSDDDLFKDSDDEDDGDGKKPAKKQAQPLTKRQRMEALQAKRRKGQGLAVSSVPKGDKKKGDGGDDDDADSMNSADYIRTQADNDFIDTEGDDAEAVAELYAEQNFGDDNLEAMEDDEIDRKKKRSGSSGRSGGGKSEAAYLKATADEDNPLLQAMLKLQKKKKEEKSTSEIMEIVKNFLDRMMDAAVADEEAIEKKQPALAKLGMLDEVYDTIVNVELQNELLDENLLTFCKRWIQPLKNGQLGNVTVRKKVVMALSTIKPGTDKRGNKVIRDRHGITKDHLKESDFGKTCMALVKHKGETPEMKKLLKKMMDDWFREIFGKSNNLRDVDQQVRGTGGVAGDNRQRFLQKEAMRKAKAAPAKAARGGADQGLDSILQKGSQGKSQSGANRVAVPFSKGFAYSVRPDSKVSVQEARQTVSSSAYTPDDARAKLTKRMIEKKRTKSKNQRSANISIEGRAVK